VNTYLPIYYSGFWDVPLAFLTIYNKSLFLFWRGYFDEELDEYPPNYDVYLVKNISLDDAIEPCEPPFKFVKFKDISLLLNNEIIGAVPVNEVMFDETKRKMVNKIVFNQLLKS
jgi:hypothetical protein